MREQQSSYSPRQSSVDDIVYGVPETFVVRRKYGVQHSIDLLKENQRINSFSPKTNVSNNFSFQGNSTSKCSNNTSTVFFNKNLFRKNKTSISGNRNNKMPYITNSKLKSQTMKD